MLGIKQLSLKHNKVPKRLRNRLEISKLTWDDVGEYLTEYEVAGIIGCSVKTLRNNRSKHVGIEYIKDGGSIKYAREAVRIYMEKNTVKIDQ